MTKPTISGALIGQQAQLSFGTWQSGATSLSGELLKDGVVWMTGLTDGQALTWSAAEDLGQFTLRVTAALVNGQAETAVSAPIQVTHVPPQSGGALPDEILDLGSGDFLLDASLDFTGQALNYSIGGAGASIDPVTGMVTIPTVIALAGAVVTVTATNSGGSANSNFLVTVENRVQDPDLTILPDEWAISGPGPDGADIVIFSVPNVAGDPVTDLQYSLDGGAWQSLGGIQAGSYRLSGLAEDSSHILAIRAMGTAPGPASDQKWFATIPGDPGGFRGWDPSADLGAVGDVFVAPYGDDMGAGTLADPFRTVGRAMTVAAPGQTIKARAGVYREAVGLKAGVALEGYRSERPQITAAEVLSGLTQCNSADANVLGAVLGASGSPVYKSVVAKTGLNYSNIFALNLFEAGRRVYVVSDRADMSRLYADDDESTFHIADTFILNGSNQITDIVDSSVINPARYTDAQLIGKEVLLYHYPNVVSKVQITAANVAQGRISVDGAKVVEGNTPNPIVDNQRYAILNVAPALSPGTCFLRDIGTDVEVYVYPRDPAHLGAIEYSARVLVLNWPASPGGNVTLRGLHLSQATGEGYAQGGNIIKSSTAGLSPDNLIEHVLSSGTLNVGGISYSFYFRGMQDTVISQCSFFDVPGRGVFFTGLSITGRGQRNMVRRSCFRRIGGAGFVVYAQDRMVFAHNYANQTGLTAHSNKSNGYEQIDGILWWGNEWGRDTNGYLTWQEASQPVVAFNLIPINSKYLRDNRAIVDQQNSTPPPNPGSTSYIFNNTIPPQAGNSGAWGHLAIDLFQTISDLGYQVVNNVTHGLTAPAEFPQPGSVVKSNVITHVGWDGVRQTSAGDYDNTNVVWTNLATVYADYGNNNFTPTPTSPILTVPGQDMQPVIASLQTTFPQFSDWTRDYRDRVIDWSLLPVGADAGASFIRS